MISPRIALASVLSLAFVPGSASALCFTVFGDKQEVLYRGTATPIDLSRPVHEGMRKAFPRGAILVIDDNDMGCSPIGPQAVFGTMPGYSGATPGAPQWQSGMTAGSKPGSPRQ